MEKQILFNQSTYILIGNSQLCAYTFNAIHAQKLGAKGIIFGMNISQNHKEIILIDDGNGRKVHITTLVITLQNLDKLKSLKNISIKTSFIVPKRQKSKVIVFLSAMGRQSYVFLRDFLPYYKLLTNSYIDLQPIYYTVECKQCNDSQCLFDKKYCVLGSQKKNFGSGELILKQQLRQYQIYKRNRLQLWLEYMDLFDKNCDYDWISSLNCSQQICNKLQIQKIITFQNNSNEIMQNWRSIEKKSGFVSYPQISVNGIVFYGNLQAQLIFDMICSGLKSQPIQCKTRKAVQIKVQKKGNMLKFIIIIIIAVILSIGIGIFCYCKFIRKQITMDMSSKVNQLVARYATKVSQQKIRRKQKLIQQFSQEL